MKWIGFVLAISFALGLTVYVKERFDQLEAKTTETPPPPPGLRTLAPPSEPPKATTLPVARWHKIYVPAYSSVLSASAKPLDLGIVLSLRNTSETDPIYFRRIDAFSADGKKVGTFATEALELAVLTAVELSPASAPAQGDAKEAPAPISHFIVEWGAKDPGNRPLIESLAVDAERQVLVTREGVEVDAGKAGTAQPPLPTHAEPLVAKTAPGKPQTPVAPEYVPVVATSRKPVLIEKNPRAN